VHVTVRDTDDVAGFKLMVSQHARSEGLTLHDASKNQTYLWRQQHPGSERQLTMMVLRRRGRLETSVDNVEEPQRSLRISFFPGADKERSRISAQRLLSRLRERWAIEGAHP
jgi:hypothetical protein